MSDDKSFSEKVGVLATIINIFGEALRRNQK